MDTTLIILIVFASILFAMVIGIAIWQQIRTRKEIKLLFDGVKYEAKTKFLTWFKKTSNDNIAILDRTYHGLLLIANTTKKKFYIAYAENAVQVANDYLLKQSPVEMLNEDLAEGDKFEVVVVKSGIKHFSKLSKEIVNHKYSNYSQYE
ncbi:MAG: hypothetical protein ACRC4M_01790 [Mycoplasma sp.]